MSARKQRALPQHIRRACAAVLRAAETYQSMSDDELMSPGKTENDQVYEGKRTLADLTGIKEELQTMGVVAGGARNKSRKVMKQQRCRRMCVHRS